jgi:hypothetical protein
MINLPRIMGIVMQGLFLGILLALALIQLVTLATGGRVFRYEAF